MPWSHMSVATLIAAAVAVGGCASRMMPTPIAYQGGDLDAFAAVSPDHRVNTVEVLYATDRNVAGTQGAMPRYGDRRGLALRLGTATVRLGSEGTEWSELERAARNDDRPPLEIVDLQEYGMLWTTIPSSDEAAFRAAVASSSPDDAIRAPCRRFAEAVNTRLARSERKEVVVYMPGFNTGFREPIVMMARFSHFMDRDGVFIAYSWPSGSTPFDYTRQRIAAAISIRNFRQLLIFLAEETSAERIDIITYSAGAPIVTDALIQLRLLHADDTADELKAATRLGNVIFAGADVDFEYFRNAYYDRIQDLAESITIYTSRDDSGLILSSALMNGQPRLGQATSQLSDADRADLRAGSKTHLVDVTDATRKAGSGDLFAHSYWYTNAWVNMDVIARLAFDLDPGDRGLVFREAEAEWVFPDDYPDRIRRMVATRRSDALASD